MVESKRLLGPQLSTIVHSRNLLRAGHVFGEACVLAHVARRRTDAPKRGRREAEKEGGVGGWLRLHTAIAVQDAELKFLHVDDVRSVCAEDPALLRSLRHLYTRRRRKSEQLFTEAMAAVQIQKQVRGFLSRKGKVFARSAARTSSHLLTAVDGELKKHRSVREQQMLLEKSAIRGLDDDSDDEALDLAEAEKAVGLAPGGAGSAELSEVREELEALSERMAAFERTVEGKLDALMAAVRVGGS